MSAATGAGVGTHVSVFAARDEAHAVTSTAVAKGLAAMRLVLGFTFLWAFVDKTFGLGYATPSENAWISGGSPTVGYLSNTPSGPLEGFYHALAGQWWVDVLFMLGLLAVGVTFVLGIGIRLGAAVGVLLYVMMWTVVLPPVTNPIIDEHIIGALAVLVAGLALAGDTWGLGRWWGSLELVKRYPILR
ncbi:thiosulfate dehydrogenase [quinone] large subunit [Mumia flava]|uniref:Thiosulfate dehydrogenase [quinone] large subunit n=1 Tax=Mumia flava TaxID=1348852 RepID=A0A2M9BIB2_9ACTN|nr:DoxX family membrane protein [Mumia flava]PJJ57688.1 thiosulfate dehydrogenase [quinone] large subunit [Mumia flava]